MPIHSAARSFIGSAALALLFLAVASVAPAADLFLRIDGIPGESQDATHRNWISLQSFSFQAASGGVAAQPTGNARLASRTAFQDITLTKTLDKSTAALLGHMAEGKNIPSAQINVLKSGPRPALAMEIYLEDVTIASQAISSSSDSTDIPSESIALSYSKIGITVYEYAADGRQIAKHVKGWDRVRNTPFTPPTAGKSPASGSLPSKSR